MRARCTHGEMRPLHDAHQPAERCKSIWAKACQGAQPWVVVVPSLGVVGRQRPVLLLFQWASASEGPTVRSCLHGPSNLRRSAVPR